ncbi:MAG: heme peroxidase family protein [Acidobacteriota bacterium]|nr:heme peroxidase family protein [Acidobacteriota bacterium]
MHGRRDAYYVLSEGMIVEPPNPLAGGGGGGHPAAAAMLPPKVSPFKFGRMFGTCPKLSPAEGKAMFDKLITLGLCMNDPATYCQQPIDKGTDESDIPAGYTYLGQFITHEVTFDNTGHLLEVGMQPESLRSPQIDLDSLYGGVNGPGDKPELYEQDRVHLKVGKTSRAPTPNEPFDNDLPRDKSNLENPRKALIGDERNDENLAVAQTHLAFIKFHNKVVDEIKKDGHYDDDLFECARKHVVRHFQWIILYDYLPRLVDKHVLDCVMQHGLRWFKVDGADGLFMPLEFSAAAFRIGHSMVRLSYEWNTLRSSDPLSRGPASLLELFQQTGFSKSPEDKNFGGSQSEPISRLPSDWIIDWRRFYDFTPLKHVPAVLKLNKTSKLDTILNLRLNNVVGFPDTKLEKMQKAITIRNLLRGYYLGLPTGEEIAEWMGETPLTHKQVADGPHQALLSDPLFREKTPLWYYVLKEADLNGGSRLGPVGSRIVAETLVGLIRKSPHSILANPGWRPRFGPRAEGTELKTFEMIDLLDFADVVDPLSRHFQSIYHQ